ncbi:MAG: hypothetical protein K2P92_07580 [Bdellovibrionaceae bacterium]|nr:hypothetical protein [Pseudobdellovibrionaceae bacterium]
MILLGVEDVKCGATGKGVCNKYICENVDNFFQCLAGEKPVYISPRDFTSRLTEPRDPAEQKPEAIDFSKFSENAEVNLQKEVVASEVKKSVVPKVKVEPVRTLASLMPEPVPISFQVTSHFGKTEINNKKLKKPVVVRSLFIVKAREKSEITVAGAKSHFTVKMTAGSEWSARTDDDVLWLNVKKGDIVVSLGKTELVHAVDVGLWRLAKRQGVFGVSVQQNLYTLLNDEGPGYLRRNELISTAQLIEPKKLIQISTDEGILAVKDIQPAPAAKTRFEMPNNGPSTHRGVASANNVSQDLCASPAASFESCAWKCFGVGTKDKKCGQAKNSHCIRFTCSADGLWKLPTTATPTECAADTVRVGVCQ